MKYCIAFFSIFLLISCNNKESEIQQRSFDVLKSLDTLSYDQYFKEYFSLEDYKALAVNKNIDKTYKDEILAVTDYQWNRFREREYENFKERGKENEIVWNNIEFVSFTYEKNVSYGLDCLDGTIYFRHNDILYETRIYTIFDGDTYQIFGLKM
ncbi:hypothetical protein [uncultured Kordia sp.]|uniref:hypothetical protein n=1 Tax=uncultured Kordia sp. TaxID=507699 RepID=UPI00260A797D|nr:hypothetical protein [uncultured Kordia sp.]